jgi:hypothetical protein
MALPLNASHNDSCWLGGALWRIDMAVDAPSLVSADAACGLHRPREIAPGGDGRIDDASVCEAFAQVQSVITRLVNAASRPRTVL